MTAIRIFSLSGMGIIATALLGCASPEAKLERYLKSGEAFLEEGRLGMANVQFRNALKIDEDNTKALIGLSDIAERKGDYSQMFGLLQRVARLDPTNDSVKLELAKLHLLGNDPSAALDILDSMLKENAENSAAMAVKSAVLFRLGNDADAVALAKATLTLDPKSTDAASVLASERVKAGAPDAALKILDDAIARDDQATVLKLLRVEILKSLGRVEDMNEAFKSLIAAYPEEAGYRRLFATALIEQNNLAEARSQLVQVASLLPKQTEAKLDVVRVDYRVGGAAKAKESFKALIAEAPDNVELRFAYGAFLREEGDLKAAEEIFSAISGTKKAPVDDVLKAKSEIAGIRMMEGRKAEAEKLLAEILAADPKHPEALIKRAGLLIDEGKLDEAIGDLRVVVGSHPESTPARLLLGAAFEQKGDIKLAETEFAEAVAASNRSAQASNLFARFLLRHGKPVRAVEALTDSLAADPANEDNLKLLAAIKLDQQDWRGAEEAALALKEVAKDDSLAVGMLSEAYAGLKDYAGAIDLLSKENQNAPLASRPLANLVQAYVSSNRAVEAEEFLAGMIASNPGAYDARVLLAQVRRHLGRSEEAKETLRAAIDREPLRPEAYEALYGLYVADGRRQDAGSLIDQAVAAAPDNDGLQVLKADNEIAVDRPDQAIAIYETIIARRPGDLIVANNLASLLLDRGDEASVARAVEVARALKGAENPYFLDTYGWAMYRAGKAEEGVAALEKAASAAPGLVDARYHLGVALIETGQAVRGRSELQAVINAAGADPRMAAEARRLLGQ
jgi:tetratricopeptide (TPR) repeat protein